MIVINQPAEYFGNSLPPFLLDGFLPFGTDICNYLFFASSFLFFFFSLKINVKVNSVALQGVKRLFSKSTYAFVCYFLFFFFF